MAINNRVFVSFLLLSVLCVAIKAETPIRKCANNEALPLWVQLNDCNKLPCDVVKSATTHMAIQFVAPKNTMSHISANVHMTALGMEVPYELSSMRSDVCSNLMHGAYCPLDAGEDVTYHLMLDISQQQPEVPTKIEVNLLDNTDASVVACFVTDVRIKKYAKTLN